MGAVAELWRHPIKSHDAVETAIGHPLEMERWRANIWLDGVAAWNELAWMGRMIRIGEAEFEIHEPCVRCELTATNPVTDVRDANTFAALQDNFGHKHFGVYAMVTKQGRVALGDQAQVL